MKIGAKHLRFVTEALAWVARYCTTEVNVVFKKSRTPSIFHQKHLQLLQHLLTHTYPTWLFAYVLPTRCSKYCELY